MYDRRLQLVLDEGRYARLTREAARRGISMAAVVREAIDALPAQDGRRSAIEAVLAAEPMDLPFDPADLRRELDDTRSRGLG